MTQALKSTLLVAIVAAVVSQTHSHPRTPHHAEASSERYGAAGIYVSNCDCDGVNVVCGEDGRSYKTPCDAACHGVKANCSGSCDPDPCAYKFKHCPDFPDADCVTNSETCKPSYMLDGRYIFCPSMATHLLGGRKLATVPSPQVAILDTDIASIASGVEKLCLTRGDECEEGETPLCCPGLKCCPVYGDVEVSLGVVGGFDSADDCPRDPSEEPAPTGGTAKVRTIVGHQCMENCVARCAPSQIATDGAILRGPGP